MAPRSPETSSWANLLALTPLPEGISVERTETMLRVRSLLPGRVRPAIGYATLAGLALAVLGFTLRAHAPGGAWHALWWAMVVMSSLIVAVALPLMVSVLRAHRVLVLNPGVLLLNEYHGLRASGVTCLRSNLRALAAVAEGERSGLHLELEMEISPTLQRILHLELTPEPDEQVLAVAAFCEGERREVVLYLGRVIAEWAELHFNAPHGSASSAMIPGQRR
jgi:hypothetical protein